jgi:hypothetical protein
MFLKKARFRLLSTRSLFIFLAFMGLALTACQNGSSDQYADIDHVMLDHRIGKIKSLGGVITSNKGTHLLELENGNSILLSSVGINLDDAEYKDKTVEVSGVLNYTSGNKQMMEVQGVDILSDDSENQTPVLSWKEYSNESLGLSLSYRDDFSFQEELNKVTFSKSAASIVIQVINNNQNQSLLQFLNIQDSTDQGLVSAGLSQNKIGTDTMNAFKKTSSTGKMIEYYTLQNGKIYHLTFDGKNSDNFQDDQNIFNEIVNSLKISGSDQKPILPPVDTSKDAPTDSPPPPKQAEGSIALAAQEIPENYVSFESSGFKFALLYPKSWYYGNASTAEKNVVRRYEFGTKPLEEEPGSVYLDIVSSAPLTLEDKEVKKIVTANQIELYTKGNSGRIYRLSGPASQEQILLNMAVSLKD